MEIADWFQIGFLVIVVGIGVGGFIWVALKE